MNRLRNKVALVTGAAQGLGFAAAKMMAREGAVILIADKQIGKGRQAVEEIRRETGNERVDLMHVDLSGREGVEALAMYFLTHYSRLDILLNNVGETHLTYMTNPEGYELTWATNFLGHFQLTYRLLPMLRATAVDCGEARIVEVTSHTYRFSKPVFKQELRPRHFFNPISGILAYSRSKRALLTFTWELARQITGTGVTINAVTPGWTRTNMADNNGPMVKSWMNLMRTRMRTLEEGVRPIAYLAMDPDLKGVNGCYYRRFDRQPFLLNWANPEAADRLWKVANAMLERHGAAIHLRSAQAD